MDLRQLTLLLLFLSLSMAAFAARTKANVQPVDLDAYYEDAIGQSGEVLKSTLDQIVKGRQAYSCAEFLCGFS